MTNLCNFGCVTEGTHSSHLLQFATIQTSYASFSGTNHLSPVFPCMDLLQGCLRFCNDQPRHRYQQVFVKAHLRSLLCTCPSPNAHRRQPAHTPNQMLASDINRVKVRRAHCLPMGHKNKKQKGTQAVE